MQYGRNCGAACKTFNCYNSARRILQDFVAASDGIFPQIPMHPSETLMHVPEQYNMKMLFLNREQVKEFFDGAQYGSGMLKVDEFCLLENQITRGARARLTWRHVYVIERHDALCYLMQSDENKFSVGHFLKPHPQEFPQQDLHKGRIEVKMRFGYHTASPTGETCEGLFVGYQEAYPELSAMMSYQENCLLYYEFKALQSGNSADERSTPSLTATWAAMAALQKDPARISSQFRVGSLNDPYLCHDAEPVPARWSYSKGAYQAGESMPPHHPGRTVALNSLRYGMDVDKFNERAASISGSGMKCTAVVSVPYYQ